MGFWGKLASFFLRNRYLVLIIFSILTLFFGYFASKVQISYEFAKLLPDDDSTLVTYKDFKSKFGEGTSIRGIKNRGSFEDLNEAKSRASFCQNLEPAVDTFVAPLGHWLPLDISPDSIKDQEYQVEELNNLMHKYNENVEQRNDFFNKRRTQMIEESNEKKEKNKKEELLKRYKERLAASK